MSIIQSIFALNNLNKYFSTQDVSPGEAVFVDLDGIVSKQICHTNPVLTPCVFEYVYFARPDSVMDGVSVYEVQYSKSYYKFRI